MAAPRKRDSASKLELEEDSDSEDRNGSSARNAGETFEDEELVAEEEEEPNEDHDEEDHDEEGLQLLHAYDHIFWAGDLNYRLDLGEHGTENEYASVVARIESADEESFAQLSEHDQLAQERAEHNVFVGFREGELKFPPTYRLECVAGAQLFGLELLRFRFSMTLHFSKRRDQQRSPARKI
ncbi:Inositol polyphosphate 5-phosphatase, putative [Hondaea fermentalgiana]|uniref:Inositol polyphosphate 5-phosphatase, putative n=1 Tax=Hondaea fermentalgiana TaxID=2315210 RepID=A0A2R5GU49_9STRA|nr:Inositol polyphosphate 5-phosphatase, putative [Hondaea fermentalgiana]|eukprot:GBG34392.1 Inositol polyphosphate 5-phosphatase, putative [Hondaea fermentalgiana]